MAKLYPPYIEENLPAFATDDNDITKFKVSYSHNPTVVMKDIAGIVMRLTSIQDNSKIADKKIVDNYDYKQTTIEFDLSDVQYKLTVGNYYKVQLAYISKDKEVGYYSTIGIVKYTTIPVVSVIQGDGFSFYSSVSQTREISDTTEKLYSVKFELYNKNTSQILSSSGEIIHNINKDEDENQNDFYDFGIDSVDNYNFICVFTYTTVNKLVGSISIEVNNTFISEPEDDKYKIIANNSYNNGCVNLQALEKKDDLYELMNGVTFYRKKINSDMAPWESIGQKNIDNTVEFGESYEYSFLYNSGNGTYRVKSPQITTFFEDAFLSDGEKQLCIRYNPKVSTFKDIILEQKVETINGKYPYIYRNGDVNYKEFQIGGLISYTADEAGMFAAAGQEFSVQSREKTPSNAEFETIKHTDLSDANIKRELEFKLQVLKWLGNGKPKLFRTPTEGNYLVRLMNISLTPEEKLGRMLHSFSATAYEIGENDLKTLKKYRIIQEDKKNG